MKFRTAHVRAKEEERQVKEMRSSLSNLTSSLRDDSILSPNAPLPKLQMNLDTTSRSSSPSPFPPSPLSLPPSTPVHDKSKKSSLWVNPLSQQEYASIIYAQLLPVLAVNLGAFSAGLGVGFPTILFSQLGPMVSNSSSWSLTTDSDPGDWIGSLYLLGAALGGLLSALLGSIFTSRRAALLACTLPDVLGWVIISITTFFPSSALPLLLVSRFLTGLAAAGYLSNIQIYVAEVAQAHHRGWLGGLSLPLASIGVLTMYVLGSWLSWGAVALVSLSPPLLLALALSQLWDSPYSYFSQGREKEAHAAMEQLRGGDPESITEIFRIQESVESEAIKGGLLARLYLLCTDKNYFSPFFILNFLILLTILSGTTTMGFYASQLFQRAGGHMDHYLSSVVISLLQLIGSCIFLPLAKNLYRKLLLVSSALIMLVCLSLLGLYFYSQTRYEAFFIAVSQAEWLPILCLSTYLITTPLGLGSIPLLYSAELFPTEMRSLLSGLTMCLGSLIMFTAQRILPSLEYVMLPHGVAWLSSSACAAAIFFSLSSIPETRNKDLSQIPEKFAQWRKTARVSPWVTPISSRSASPSISRAASPSISRAASPSINTDRKFQFKTQMFTQ